MKTNTRKTLELFIEKVELLLSFSFTTESLKGIQLKSTTKADRGTEIVFTGPNEEAVHAFLYTYRLFIQDGDGISLHELSTTVLQDPAISNNWKDEFSRVRREINEVLDAPPGLICIVLNDQLFSRRDIQDIFVYGNISHIRYKTDETKRELYETFRSKPDLYGAAWFVFVDTLFEVLRALAYISELSKQELQALHAPPS